MILFTQRERERERVFTTLFAQIMQMDAFRKEAGKDGHIGLWIIISDDRYVCISANINREEQRFFTEFIRIIITLSLKLNVIVSLSMIENSTTNKVSFIFIWKYNTPHRVGSYLLRKILCLFITLSYLVYVNSTPFFPSRFTTNRNNHKLTHGLRSAR